MICTLKKIFALFLANLLWFSLSDDDSACLSSQVQFFLCGKWQKSRFHDDKASCEDLQQLS